MKKASPVGAADDMIFGIETHIIPSHNDLQAISKNSFLMIGAEDFGARNVMEKTEYFVYCGFFITHD